MPIASNKRYHNDDVTLAAVDAVLFNYLMTPVSGLLTLNSQKIDDY